MEFHNGFESIIILNNKKESISKENHYDISYNKNIGFIEDYFNFSNNNISIHLLKKKYEKSSSLNPNDFTEVNEKVNKLIERFEVLDLKKFSMPVVVETLASFIEESNYNPSKIEENKEKKIYKQKYLYFLLMILFNIDRIKTKLLEDYKILLLLNKIKIPTQFEEVMKKENFYENYYNPLANLLSEFYVKNEIIAFYVKLINLYFTKTVLKHNNNSEIDNYVVKPKLLVEKSLIKLTAILAKKLAGFVLPCVKNILTLNPMFTMFASAGGYLINMCVGKIEKKIEKQSEMLQNRDIYKFITLHIKEIGELENHLLDLIKNILFYKISKTKENKDRYKDKISKTKEYLTQFSEIEELEKIYIEKQEQFPQDPQNIGIYNTSLEECFKDQNSFK